MELKKCPFCGSEAKLVSDRKSYEELCQLHGKACILISCKSLFCGADYFHHSDTDDYDTKLSEAIERWNHRAEDEESESL